MTMKIDHISWKSYQIRSLIIGLLSRRGRETVCFASTTCWVAAVIGMWTPAALAQLPPQGITTEAPLDTGSPKTSGGFTMTRSVTASAISYAITRPNGQSIVNFSRNIPGGATGANFSVRACFLGPQGAQNALFLVANTTSLTQAVLEPVFFNLSQSSPTERTLFSSSGPNPAPFFLLSNDRRFLFTKLVHTTVAPSTMDAHEIGVYRTDTGDQICFQGQVNGSPADTINAELRDDSSPNDVFDHVRILLHQSGADISLQNCALPSSPAAQQTPTITSFSPTSGAIGTNMTVTGANFTGATGVAFNNTTTTAFTVNTAGTQITTTVPTGATTGRIGVTTPAGTGTSAGNFTMILPTVSFSTGTADNDATAMEPSDNAFFTLTRTGNTSNSLTVRLGFGGTATNGTDYNQIPSTVTIPQNSASTRVTITTLDDNTAERAETVDVALQADAAYVRGTPSTRNITIQDNEPPQVSIASNKSTVPEAGTPAERTATLTFTRLGSLASPLDVGFTVSPSTPGMVAGTDFTTTSSPAHFAAGASTATRQFTAVDDPLDEEDETARIAIQSGAGYTTSSPSSVTVSITDNEASPTIEFTSSSVTTKPIRVRLSAVSGRDVTVNFNLSNGTASACRDCNPHLGGNLQDGVTNATCHGYLDRGPLPQKRIIPAGSNSVTIDCMVCPGSSGKTFFVNLLAPENAILGSVTRCEATIQ